MLTDHDLEEMEDIFQKERRFTSMGGMGLRLVAEIRRLRKEARDAQMKGIRMAAGVASDYDGSSSHPYLVSDCILGKLNVRKGQPRKNPGARKLNAVISAIERKLDSVEAMTKFMAAMAREKKGDGSKRSCLTAHMS